MTFILSTFPYLENTKVKWYKEVPFFYVTLSKSCLNFYLNFVRYM